MKWTTTLPTEEGMYWFYGWDFYDLYKNYNHEPELRLLKVNKCMNGFAYAIGGHFFKNKEAVGYYTLINLPDITMIEKELYNLPTPS